MATTLVRAKQQMRDSAKVCMAWFVMSLGAREACSYMERLQVPLFQKQLLQMSVLR